MSGPARHECYFGAGKVITMSSMTLGARFGDVPVTAAELGSNLLMIGAAELAFERLLGDPNASMSDITTMK